MTIDWSRLAKPQVDGYDTLVIQEAAASKYAYRKKSPEGPAWLDGAVQLSNQLQPPSGGLSPAGFDHPSLVSAEQYLSLWPECYAQAQCLLQVIFIFDAPQFSGARGCFCGTSPRQAGREHLEDGAPFGEVFSTLFDPVGFVEGIVHEMAHWKLHALGIHFERWDDRLLLNGTEELFESSIRKDKPRPMGAVLHAHWVCLHVLAVELVATKLRAAERDSDVPIIDAAAARVCAGRSTIEVGARRSQFGNELWDGMQSWTKELLASADAFLRSA